MNVQNRLDLESGAASGTPDTAIRPEAGFNLVDFLRVLRVRRYLILGTAAAVIGLSILYLMQATPIYTASSVVLLDQRKNKVLDVEAALSGLSTDQASIQNQVQILTSRQLAGRVIDKLHLERDPQFNPARSGSFGAFLNNLNPLKWFSPASVGVSPEEQRQRVREQMIDRLLSRLNVEPIGLSSALMVSFSAKDPDQAADICNAISDAYVLDQLNAKFEAAQKASRWLADRIQQLSAQVQNAESAVQQYRAAHNLTEMAVGGSVVDQQLNNINSQLVLAKSALAEKEAIYQQVVSMARSGHEADVAQVVSSPLITQLRGQEADLIRQEAELSTRYGPRYPKMIDMENERKNLDAKIAQEVQRIVESVRSDVGVARANLNSLQGSLGQLEGQSQTQNKDKVQLAALEAAATSSRSMYEAFLSRLKQTQGEEGIQTPDARVISQATPPAIPSSPRQALTLAISIPGGILLGLLLAFGAERLDNGFRTVSQVEKILGLPVLATVPELAQTRRGLSANPADRIVDKPMSAFAEALRSLQLGLTLSNVDKQPKIILVTSSVPGEGKTTLAVSLARLAARSGKRSIIVDCDLRRPSVARTVELTDATLDILDCLSGAVPLDGCLYKDPKSDALVLPCLKNPANTSDLVSSQAMERLIATLAKTFDCVFIDSSPLLPVIDTKLLCQNVDTVLFVTRWERTPRDAVRTAVRGLLDVDAPVAGVALTRADTERFQYYSYGYQSYYNYNKYYTN